MVIIMLREILFIIVQVAANIIQAITGFAGGPLAMPPSMALVGVANAKAAITLILWLATIIVTIQNIKLVNWKKLGIMLGFMIVGVVAGIELFSVLPTLFLMIAYGVIVILIGLMKLLRPGKDEIKAPWNYLALLVAGLMQGLFTSGGPFLALYATSAIKDKKEFRATVSPVWSILNIYMIFSMWQKGMYTPYVLKLSLASLIPVVLAIFIGNKINKKMKQETFLKLVYVLLMISGGVLLFNAVTA